MTIEVFISYSQKDQTFREELEIHLSNLKRQKIITSWYDGNIAPGAELKPQIMAHLKSAQIILLLISADFIHSDFCYSIEMKQAIDRHNAGDARVIPILLRPTDWQSAPFDKLKMLPTDAKAVTRWRRRDDAFADIVQGIRASINDLTNTGKTTNPSIVSYTPSSGKTQVEQIWNIPYQRNPLFTGREDVLKKLYDALRAGKTAALAQPQAISGLGGIGKTQTAVEYAYRYRDDYKSILWVKAETDGSIISDFMTIAQLLNLPEKQEQEQLRIVEAVKRWFQAQSGWLLIFDNADDLAMVRDFLPPGGKGHILLTTRAHATGRIAQRIEVEKMEPEEGALFLLHRATILDPDAPLDDATKTDCDTAKAIVQAMDGLPLALEQAGAYIEETACGLQGYLRLYRAQGVRLLKEHGEFAPDHPKPVATTWSLSFEKVEQANAAAAELLRFCAFLAPDVIPEELFTESALELSPSFEQVVSDPSSFNTAVKELLKYSLVQRDPETQTLSIHRLVQEVLKGQMDVETQRIWAERTVRAVNRVFPKWKVSNRLLCRRLFPQAQACFELIMQWDMIVPEAASLLHRAARYLRKSPKRYGEAELFDQQALKIQEKALGKEHMDVAQTLYGLAVTYEEWNKYEQSESFFRRAIAICEQVFGPQAPETFNILSELGYLYYKQGKYDEAASLHQRCLTIREQAPDPNDKIATSTSLNNLALVYSKKGKYDEAEALYKRALEIRERVSGKQSINAAITLRNLAGLYKKQGKYELAEPLYQQAIANYMLKYGLEDRGTARCLKGLADLYCKQGEYKKAEPLYQQALSVWKEFLGLDHIEAAEVLESYADLLQKMRRKREAASLEVEARAVRNKIASQEVSH